MLKSSTYPSGSTEVWSLRWWTWCVSRSEWPLSSANSDEGERTSGYLVSPRRAFSRSRIEADYQKLKTMLEG